MNCLELAKLLQVAVVDPPVLPKQLLGREEDAIEDLSRAIDLGSTEACHEWLRTVDS